LFSTSTHAQTLPPGQVNIVEYRHPKAYSWTTDHFFITAMPEEQELLDAHSVPVLAPWERTETAILKSIGKIRPWSSRAWKTIADCEQYPGSLGRCRAVARFYGPNTHFYTLEPAERDLLLSGPLGGVQWILEDPQAFVARTPVNGVCLTGEKPVYRSFNNGLDANHRFTNHYLEHEALLKKGYIDEGLGFCAISEDAEKVFVANLWPLNTQTALGNTGPFSCMNQVSVITLLQPAGGTMEHLCVWSASGTAVAVSNALRNAVIPASGSGVHTVSVADNSWNYSSLPGTGDAIARDLVRDVFYFARGNVSPDGHNDVIAYDEKNSTTLWTMRVSEAGYTAKAIVTMPQKLYVLFTANQSNTPGKVVVLDARSGTLLATIPVSARPLSGAVDHRSGLLYVATSQGKMIEVIDTKVDVVIIRENFPYPELQPIGVAMDSAQERLYVTAWSPLVGGYVQRGQVFYKDLRLNTWSTPLTLGYDPTYIAIVPYGGSSYLYIPNSNGNYFKTGKIVPDDYGVSVVNTATWQVINRLPSESGPIGIDVYVPE